MPWRTLTAASAPGNARERAVQRLDPDDPERPEPAWDATQPHVPFPMLGETQAISMTHLLDEPEGSAAAPAEAQTDAPTPRSRASPSDHGENQTHGERPQLVEAIEDSQPVPVVATDADASPFEIDEVEALPDDADGVLDLHEGASDFVPVTSADHPHHDSDG